MITNITLFFYFLTTFFLFITHVESLAKSKEGTVITKIQNCVCTGKMEGRVKVDGGYVSKLSGLGHRFYHTISLVSGGGKVIFDCPKGKCIGKVGYKNTELGSNFKADNDFCGQKVVKGGLCKINHEPTASTDEPKKTIEWKGEQTANSNSPDDFEKDLKTMVNDAQPKPSANPGMKPNSEERKKFDSEFCRVLPNLCNMY